MITLKTLHVATEQEVFDQVLSHLRRQGRPSKGKDGGCKYRGVGNLKCAAGCLIADDEYKSKMDNLDDTRWLSLVSEGLVPNVHIHLIRDLQVIHDQSADPFDKGVTWIDNVETRFCELAKEYNLEFKLVS